MSEKCSDFCGADRLDRNPVPLHGGLKITYGLVLRRSADFRLSVVVKNASWTLAVLDEEFVRQQCRVDA
jgi:hypothetical protein